MVVASCYLLLVEQARITIITLFPSKLPQQTPGTKLEWNNHHLLWGALAQCLPFSLYINNTIDIFLITVFLCKVDDVNSMFSNLDELRKNGWIQTQPPSDEVIINYCCMKISVLCVFLLNAHYLVSMAKWLNHCALAVRIIACYGVHCSVSQCRGHFAVAS